MSLLSRILLVLLAAVVGILADSGCTRKVERLSPLTQADSLRILREITEHRASLDSAFRLDPESPFRVDTTARFTGIKWFPPDIRFYFRSKLYRFKDPETVIVFGTKGEQRSMLKYGYFLLFYDGKEWHLNAYKSAPDEAGRTSADPSALSVWFTDSTTGHETYHVGRYVDVGEEDPDPSHMYVIDFNNAYNPYCAYSGLYTCAVPRKEDHLDFSVRAGEMTYAP